MVRIFLSAVTTELKPSRETAARVLRTLGYEPVYQDEFPAGAGDLRKFLRELMDPCDAVLQLVGYRYGAEPVTVDPEYGRVSYTQYEAEYGRRAGKKVYYLLLGVDCAVPGLAAEDELLRGLQEAYREKVTKRGDLYHRAAGLVEMELKVHQLHDELKAFRDRMEARAAEQARAVVELAAGQERRHTEVLGSVQAQRPYLPLDRKPNPLHPPNRSKELTLLLPESRAVPLLGREADLAALRAWLVAPELFAVAARTGPAGTGKTRLAIELMDGAPGWTAGFVPSSALEKYRDATELEAGSWQGDTLWIVDYAGGLGAPLQALLAAAATRVRSGGGAGRLRVLLLERVASAEASWFSTLRGAVGGSAFLPDPEPIAPLEGTALRRELFTAFATAAEQHLPVAAVPLEPGSIGEPDFTGDKWLQPLVLEMAVLVAREKGWRATLALAATELATHLAEREGRRLLEFAGGRLPPGFGQLAPQLLHAAAAVTLAGGLADDPAWVAAELAAAHLEWPGGPGLLLGQVREALGRDEKRGVLAPVLPDLVGEAFALRHLAAPAEAAIHRLAHLPESRVAATLVRALQDYSADFPLAHDPATPAARRAALLAPRALALLESLLEHGLSGADYGVIAELEGAIPLENVELRFLAARASGALLTFLDALPEERAASEPIRVERARVVNNFATELSQLGQRDESLAAARRAVSLYRELAVRNRDAFLPDVAMSLSNLANRLSDLGQREDALAAAREALALHRELAGRNRDAFLPNLAGSLNNLANRLSNLGQREDALAAAREALALRWELAGRNRDAFLQDVAGSLNNLALILSELGQRQDALEAAREAVSLYRELAGRNRDAFLPNLATSHNNLANMLSDLGQRNEALASAREAVSLYRELVGRNQDAFLPNLATSLNNLAAILSDLRQREDALAAARDAVALYRELVVRNRDAFLPNLAASLNNLAALLSALGTRDEALEAAREALTLRRGLAGRNRDAFLPNLATSLNTLANVLSDLGQPADALAAAREAVSIMRELVSRDAQTYLPKLALYLAAQGTVRRDCEEWTEAAGCFAEALKVQTVHLQAYPAAFAHIALGMMRHYLEMCERAGREPDTKLLAPVVEVLKAIEGEGGDGSADTGEGEQMPLADLLQQLLAGLPGTQAQLRDVLVKVSTHFATQPPEALARLHGYLEQHGLDYEDLLRKAGLGED